MRTWILTGDPGVKLVPHQKSPCIRSDPRFGRACDRIGLTNFGLWTPCTTSGRVLVCRRSTPSPFVVHLVRRYGTSGP